VGKKFIPAGKAVIHFEINIAFSVLLKKKTAKAKNPEDL
jgi:hypothetical protein